MKKLLIVLLSIVIISCQKDTGPDETSQWVGKYDNGVFVIEGVMLPTPSHVITNHTVTRIDNSTINIESEIKSTNNATIVKTNQSVIRTSAKLKRDKSADDSGYMAFTAEGGFTKANFGKRENETLLNITIIQNNGTRIDNTIAVRN